MARTFGPLDLVQLPKLDASGALALGAEVIAAAKGKNLNDQVADALSDLVASHKALQSAIAHRLPLTISADPARTKAADTALDACWSALFDLLSAWAKLPDHSNVSIANALAAQLFPEGLKFVLAPYKLEWAESNTRLQLVKSQKLEGDLERLGAGPFLKRLREAHKEYGDALGITTATQAEEATTTVREAFQGFATALRHYIVRVAAAVAKKDPKTAELAKKLLSPIEEWQAPGAAPKAPNPPPEGQPPPNPPSTPVSG